MNFNDPYKLVEKICQPISKYVPNKLKVDKKTPLYGFIYGGFQTTIETAFFGQVINYSFTAKKPYNWNVKNVYKTFPKNLNGLIPYYTTTRCLQVGLPQSNNRNWKIRTLTPVLVLPYEHLLTYFTNKLNPSIPRPICSIYQNILPFTCMELILEASQKIKPNVNKTLQCVLSNGWAQLTTAGIGNAFGYFMNHPFYILNVFMKQNPNMNFIQAIKFISS